MRKKYEEATDICNFLGKSDIAGYCRTFIDEYERVEEKNKEIGVVPMVRNYEYDFFYVDYGFMVYVLEEYVKDYYRLMEKDEALGIETARKIHADFAENSDENLSKNSNLLMSFFDYHGLSFPNRKSKYLYTQVLFRNNKHKNFLLLNAVSVNLDVLFEILKMEETGKFFENKVSKIIEKVAHGVSANTQLKTMKGVADVYQIWSRDTGFNNDILGK